MTNEQKLSVLMAYYRQKVRYINADMDRLHGETEIHSILLHPCELNISNKYSFFDSHVSISEITIPLRTVEQMTDEEIQESLKYIDDAFFIDFDDFRKGLANSLYKWDFSNFPIPFIDYITSIGIARDVIGITVQEMVDDGIVTLIK